MAIEGGEWIALVERLEAAMCIVPFTPSQEDVITLLSMAVNGHQHMLRAEDLERQVQRLRMELAESEKENDQWQKKLAEVWLVGPEA